MRRIFRRFRYFAANTRKVRLICFLISAVVLAIALIATSHLKTLLANLAVTRVQSTVNRMVAASVNSALDSGEIRYGDLITFEKDHSGAITALQSNIAEFNRLQAMITQDVLERLSAASESTLAIPVGTLSGSALLAGRGPAINVKMQTLGSCSAHFENQFSDAGINQATHRILLYVDVSVSIMLPGFNTYTTVSNAFSVAETVIVGAVPDSYTYFHSGNDAEQDAYEYSINGA